jgi:hypothetical protein
VTAHVKIYYEAEGAPDVVVTSVWTEPATPIVGEECELKVEFQNQGSETAYDIQVDYFINGTDVQGDSHDELAPGEFRTESEPYTFTSEGNYSYLACAMVESCIGDSNNSNNCDSIEVAVVSLIGACCISSGSCTVLSADECSNSNGNYLGDDTNCNPNPCPQPLGACCVSGSCTQQVEEDCIANGGRFFGDNSQCETDICIMYVCFSGCAYDSIQDAVDASMDGDEIVVMPGTYTSTQDGHVVDMLGKSVTLRSTDPSDPDVVAATIIDGEDTRRGLACFNEETSETTISGFTIVNGYGVSYDYFGNMPPPWVIDGGGMVNVFSNPTVTDCIFTENNAERGGGMYNFNSSPTLSRCTFAFNTSTMDGGGMYNSSSNPSLSNCSFTFNNAISEYGGDTYGGGITNDDSSPEISNCMFSDNTADYGGVMFNYDNSTPTITDCSIENNFAYIGAGIYNYYSSSSILLNCFISNNTALYSGGGIRNSSSSSAVLTGTIVCGNTPDQIYGNLIDYGGNCIAETCDDVNADDIPDECQCFEDTNNDGMVDVIDILEVIANWHSTSGGPSDVNQDGIVDVLDILAIIAGWGVCE